MLDLIIKNGSCYIDKNLKIQDIAVKDGKIVEIGKITDETRIDKVLPILKYLLKKKSKIIIISHVGRPNGRWNENLSLKPICENLEKNVTMNK